MARTKKEICPIDKAAIDGSARLLGRKKRSLNNRRHDKKTFAKKRDTGMTQFIKSSYLIKKSKGMFKQAQLFIPLGETTIGELSQNAGPERYWKIEK